MFLKGLFFKNTASGRIKIKEVAGNVPKNTSESYSQVFPRPIFQKKLPPAQIPMSVMSGVK